jgi:hypothetical protein
MFNSSLMPARFPPLSSKKHFFVFFFRGLKGFVCSECVWQFQWRFKKKKKQKNYEQHRRQKMKIHPVMVNDQICLSVQKNNERKQNKSVLYNNIAIFQVKTTIYIWYFSPILMPTDLFHRKIKSSSIYHGILLRASEKPRTIT